MAENVFPEQPVLLVDDEGDWLRVLALSLRVSAGINHVVQCTSSREVLPLLEQQDCSLVLLDLNMPFLNGDQLLAQIRERYPDLPVIVISGMNQIETAIRCIKAGAADFFVKTDPRERVAAGVLKILKQSRLQQENRRLANCLLQREIETDPAFAPILTRSPKIQAIFAYLKAIACSVEPVLITGESGVGKELVARALHRVSCPDRPWVAVNVAGLDDTVFSDTLFGHVRGAYTGADRNRAGMIEEAQNGLLFLDEIGDLSISSQIKLLRLLQEGEYYPLGSDKPRQNRARLLVATNQDLPAKEAAGQFRRDLLYRLWAHRVEIPPLRERKEDIGPLLQFFLAQAATEMGKAVPTCPPELETLLTTHRFPGNVRELRALVFNAVSLHRRGVLSLASFRQALPARPERGKSQREAAVPGAQVRFGEDLPTLKQISGLLVEEALQRAAGNRSIAARLLGISHQALSKRLNKAE
jgi:DNA-binding NtrC family response regulator